MSMSINVNVGGTWQTVTPAGLYINLAGTWTQMNQAWVNVGGTWEQVYTSFTNQLITFSSGTGSVTVPVGASNVVIEVWGGGGGGEGGDTSGSNHYGGQGGTSGSYCRSSYACSAGQTLNYSVGTGGAGGASQYGAPQPGTSSIAQSGSLVITTMTAYGGNTGTTAVGGNQANDLGNTGTVGGLNTAGVGGPGVAGVDAGPGGAGGNSPVSSAGATGAAGLVSFYFT